MANALSPEKKAAAAILKALNDVTLNLPLVGFWLAEDAHESLYSNLAQVISAANGNRNLALEAEDTSAAITVPVIEGETPYLVRCAILSEVWQKRGDLFSGWREEDCQNIWEMDLAYAVAFASHKGLFPLYPAHEKLVADAWIEYLEDRDITEDTGFASLEDIDAVSDTHGMSIYELDQKPGSQSDFFIKWDGRMPDLEGRTRFGHGCHILRDFWLDRQHEPAVQEFYASHTTGMVMAGAVADGLCLASEDLAKIVSLTWSAFYEQIGCGKNTMFWSYEELKSEYPGWGNVAVKRRKM